MRVSCNGCRVLRKGCGRNCSIRSCLQWIQCPHSQANATFFLAKFYGRSTLFNLINAAPEHLRPAIFRSLLYEACGRIVNPVHGSVGLLWSGSWSLCESAVDAVLSGAPVAQVGSEFAAEPGSGPPFKACDIRNLCRDRNAGPPNVVNRVRRPCRFKRRPVEPKAGEARTGSEDGTGHEELEDGSPSHESLLSSRFEANGERRETQLKAKTEFVPKRNDEAVREELELELTLGLERTSRCRHVTRAQVSDPSCDVSVRWNLRPVHPA